MIESLNVNSIACIKYIHSSLLIHGIISDCCGCLICKHGYTFSACIDKLLILLESHIYNLNVKI